MSWRLPLSLASALLRLAVDPFAHDEAPLLVFAFGVVIAALYGGFRRRHHRNPTEHPCFGLPFRSTSPHVLRLRSAQSFDHANRFRARSEFY